jgi:hypothetical protein
MIAAVLFIVGGLVVVFPDRAPFWGEQDRARSPEPQAQSGKPGMTQVVFSSNTTDGRKLLTLTADRIEQRSKRLGHLVFNPLKEMYLANVRLEIHRYREPRQQPASSQPAPTTDPEANEEENLLPIKDLLQAMRDMPSAATVRVEPFAATLFRDGRPFVTLAADRLLIIHQGEDCRLIGHVVLSATAGDSLRAGEARWAAERKALLIPGEFVLTTARGEDHGSHAAFQMSAKGTLNKIPLPPDLLP